MNNATKINRIPIKDGNYLRIDRNVIFDRNLTTDAIILLMLLLNNDDDWKINLKVYQKQLGWSESKMTRNSNLLKASGYLAVKKSKIKDGKFAYHYTVNEKPALKNEGCNHPSNMKDETTPQKRGLNNPNIFNKHKREKPVVKTGKKKKTTTGFPLLYEEKKDIIFNVVQPSADEIIPKPQDELNLNSEPSFIQDADNSPEDNSYPKQTQLSASTFQTDNKSEIMEKKKEKPVHVTSNGRGSKIEWFASEGYKIPTVKTYGIIGGETLEEFVMGNFCVESCYKSIEVKKFIAHNEPKIRTWTEEQIVHYIRKWIANIRPDLYERKKDEQEIYDDYRMNPFNPGCEHLLEADEIIEEQRQIEQEKKNAIQRKIYDETGQLVSEEDDIYWLYKEDMQEEEMTNALELLHVEKQEAINT